VWFPPDERTLATSLATAANDLGCTLGFLLGPYLVQDAGGMAVLLQLTLAMSVPPLAFACCRCFPAAPRVHTHTGGGGGDGGGNGGGGGGGGGGEPIQVQLKRVARQRSYVALSVLAGSIAGVSTAWNGTFQTTLGGVAALTSKDIGWIGFTNSAGYNAGEFVAAVFGERIFRQRLRRAITYGLVLALASTAVFAACLPSPWSATGSESRAWIYTSSALAGLGTGFCYPLYLELAAEITYPAPEGVSSSGIGLVYNVGALVVLSVESSVNPNSINLVMVATIAFSAMLLSQVSERYRRSEHEGACGGAVGGAGLILCIDGVEERLLPAMLPASKAA
jgi:hypothetical protein